MHGDGHIDPMNIAGLGTLDGQPSNRGIDRATLSASRMVDRFSEEAGSGRGFGGTDLLPGSLSDNFSPMDPCAWTEIDNMVGGAHGVFVMFDDKEGVTSVTKATEDAEKLLIVARVETDSGFIEYVEYALKIRTELRGEADTLGFAS